MEDERGIYTNHSDIFVVVIPHGHDGGMNKLFEKFRKWFGKNLGPDYHFILIAESSDDRNDFDLKLFQNPKLRNYTVLTSEAVIVSHNPTQAEHIAVAQLILGNIKQKIRIYYRP